MDTVKHYITMLADDMQRQQQLQAENAAIEAERLERELTVFRESAIPLEERLKKLIATIPEQERNTPRQITWFTTRLRGTRGRVAHPGNVAEALRKLGWKRVRCWSDIANGFRAMWHPPR